MPITLTSSQLLAFNKMKAFLHDQNQRVFILKGYAGTGKTTLMKFFIEELKSSKKQFKLLASTGRAAKILSDLTGCVEGASTIHSMIYSFADLNQDLSDKTEKQMDETGQLFLIFEPQKVDDTDTSECVYIIDEASMVSDVADTIVTQAKFGSGRILKELLEYDTRKGSKYIFVGDPCQLPPIQETFSPALSTSYFKQTFHLDAQEAQLVEIMRQKGGSQIVTSSKNVRSLYANAPVSPAVYGKSRVWGKLPFSSCCKLSASLEEMIDKYIKDIRMYGYEQAIFICKSNRACLEISQFVRKSLGLTAPVVQKGDLLMVTQNNILSGLVNGDMVEVLAIEKKREIRAGQVFRVVRVRELFSKRVVSVPLMESTLEMMRGNLDSVQQTALFVDFIARMKKEGITQKNKQLFNIQMMQDPYLNALRCSYGYAITCHKAQGGEWPNVYVHVPRNYTLNPTKETYQWIYTAMTRAKESLNMVQEFYIN